jgi:thioredoxin-related protein
MNKLHISAALTGLIVCSMVLNVIQSSRISALEQAILNIKAEKSLRPGMEVPSITAFDLAGRLRVVPVSKTNRPTLVYVFATRCSWCDRNLANIKALTEAVAGTYEVVGLSLSGEGLRQYVVDRGLGFACAVPVPTVVAAYRLSGTPQTIVVSAEGKILKSWIGAYQGVVGKEIQAFFGVRLPGVLPPKTVRAELHD